MPLGWGVLNLLFFKRPTESEVKMYQARRNSAARLLTIEQAAGYVGMGKSSFRKWANEIGATRVFSARMTRYDREVIDAALDALKDGGKANE